MTQTPNDLANETSHTVQPAVMLGENLSEWNSRVENFMAQGARIIAFRGAGTVNGIEPQAAEASTEMLRGYVSSVTEQGTPVVLMYDGDEDNRQKPDLGSVFGSLADSLANNPLVTPVAAQTKSWYYPRTPNGPIESASGEPYETYVFSDNLPGSHASLTQSESLVAYPGYEQVFVGPAGPIAFSQLQDVGEKAARRPAESGPVKVTIFETPNNPAITSELTTQLQTTTDEATRAKITAKLAQREQPYGALFTADGQFTVDPNQYPGVSFSVVPVTSQPKA